MPAPVIEEMFGAGNPDRTILTLPLMKQTSEQANKQTEAPTEPAGESHSLLFFIA